jgi:hypothetical protein
MSREEAAMVYLDCLLSFHGQYQKFQRADQVLKEEDKRLLQNAVFARTTCTAPVEKKE